MEKATRLALVTIVVYHCIHGSHTTCSDDSDEEVDGILGNNITLSCRMLPQCDNVFWRIETHPNLLFASNLKTDHFNKYASGGISFLNISTITFNDTGSYSCWCYKNNNLTRNSAFCSVTLTTICQAAVRLQGEIPALYNSSNSKSHVVNVVKGKRINITCPRGGDPETNCSNVEQSESSEFTYSFKVRKSHNSCRIACQVRRNEEVICSVNFTLNVYKIKTSEKPLTVSAAVSTTVADSTTVSPKDSTTSAQLGTTNTSTTISAGTHARTDTTIKYVQKKKQDTSVTDTPGSFPVIIPVGILVFILMGVSFVLCFYIFSSRSKFNSRSNKKIKKVNSSSDDNIPIGPTYATVDKSSDRCEKGDDDSMEQEVPCTDGFYSEVNDARNVNSTTQKANPARTETSITYEHYSEVNISNAELDSKEDGAKNDSNLYSEIEKKQPRQKESSQASSGGSVQSGQTDQVVEQRNSYLNETVDDTSTTQVLYAVVDKKKK